MTRRALLSILGLAAVSLAASARLAPVLAKNGSDGSGGADGGGKDAKPVEGTTNTDDPGTEAQPADATQCAAGTDCKKK